MTGTVYLGLGSNLGPRLEWLEGAVQSLQRDPRFLLLRRAQVFESRALGKAAGDDFLNTAVSAWWEGEPDLLLALCQSIELEFGRERPYPDAPRTLDIDLLWWEGLQLNSPGLCLPHPRLCERAFALVPLLEIAPHLVTDQGVPLSYYLSGALFDQGIEVAPAVAGRPDAAHV